MSFQVESGVHEYKRTYSNYRFIPIQHYKKMQVICLSSLLFLLGFSHAEIAMSPTDTAISTINKAAQLASTMKTTDSSQEIRKSQTTIHWRVQSMSNNS